MKKINFKDKKVLITGASTGIGKALSLEFAKRGALVALGSLPEEKDIITAHALPVCLQCYQIRAANPVRGSQGRT